MFAGAARTSPCPRRCGPRAKSYIDIYRYKYYCVSHIIVCTIMLHYIYIYIYTHAYYIYIYIYIYLYTYIYIYRERERDTIYTTYTIYTV